MTKANECTCPSGDGSLRHPCPAHPAVDQADVAAKLTFINGRPAMCGCQVEYSDGGGEYSDVIYVTLCAKHSGSAILDLVATNRIALTPEYEGQWHADLYLDREIPLAKVEGATPAEAVLALMSAERIDPEQESVEQAGGDERAAFELFVRKHCGMPAHIAVNWDAKFTNDAWEGWKARAALAQPSQPPHPASELDFSRPLETENGDPVKWICADVIEYKSARVCVAKDTGLVYSSPYIGLKIRNVMPEQAEAERPEVVAWQYRVTAGPQTGWSLWHPGKGEEFERSYTVERRPLMTVAQHDRIVGELRADRDSWAEQAEQRLADWDEMRKERDAALAEVERLRQSKGDPSGSFDRCMKMMYERDENAKQLEVALARVAELEKQEPVATIAKVPGEDWNGLHFYRDLQGMQPGTKLYAAPAVQAQQLHDLDKQCRDDVARALGLRPSQERGFAWSYLLASIKSCVKASEDSAQAQHSVPETTNEEANSFLRVADAGQFKDNAVAVRTAAVIIRSLLHRPALMQSIIRHRIGLTPEYEGQWHADLYGEDGEVQHHAEADTPDEAVRAVVALAAAPSQAQHSVPEGWVQSLPLKDHQPCKPNEDRANGYTIPIYSRPVLVEEALRKLRAVLCDQIGNVVIDGSDGDREEVQRALGMLAAAPGKEGV
ncbi:hypothetical protein [Pseudomonas aeruginosa]|uniref:hypothetical protein n=1 Tax=Pseudomonas aeruginosa TaxID=287 RepID=UPI00191BB1D5|nr:hypothetical protein [Pseudomonas aeruginosa]MDV7887173.1 hypothetical protein [Pseudomonas aeruginosa]GLE69236.1 hypothetical protein VNPA110517_30730 [Pseudomonas aeruginosa]HBO7307406.1 hypothetical protein [Pseudomonas aeruginosa]